MSLNKYEDLLLQEKDQSLNPAAAPKVADSPYESALQEESAGLKSNIAQSMEYAKEKEPTRMEKALKMAKDVGLDVGTVERNMETIEKKTRFAGVDYEAMVRDTPGVAKFMGTPENAAFAQDDLATMGRIEKAVGFVPKRDTPKPMVQFGGEMAQAGETGWNNLKSSMAGLMIAFGKGDRDMIVAQAEMNKRAKELSDKRPDYSKEFNNVMAEEGGDVNKAWNKFKNGFSQWSEGKKLEALKSIVVGDVEMVAEGLDLLRHAVTRPRGLTYSISENAVNAAPSIGLGAAGVLTGPYAVVATPAGAFAGSAVSEVGSVINSAFEQRGVDITDPDQLEAAYKDADLMKEVRAQALRKGLTTAAVDGLFAAFGGQFVSKAAKGASLAKKTAAFAKDVAVESAGEVVGEFSGQIAEQKGDLDKVDLGSAIQEGITSLGQSTIQAASSASAKKAFAARKLFNKDPMKATDELLSKTDKSMETLQNAVALDEMGKAIKETKNLKNIPDKIAELVEAATGGQGAAAVYFQADDFDSYWNKKGVNPLEKAAEIMGDDGKAYQEAKAASGVIEVPLEKYAASVGVTEDFDGLLPVTRTTPDGMSLEEAKEHMAALPSLMKQIAEEATQVNQEMAPQEQAIEEKARGVKDIIQERLVAAGRPTREAKFAAELVEKSFTNIGQRMGFSPEQFVEFADKYLPKINQPTNEEQVQEQEVMFNQAVKAQFYSKLESTVEQKMGGSASREQLTGMLRDMKPEEMKWSGLNEFLKTKDKFSKQEVVDFLRANALKIEEVTKGESVPALSESEQATLDELYKIDQGDMTDEQVNQMLSLEAKLDRAARNKPKVKYEKYKLPGGDNYRELLFTLPPRAVTTPTQEEIGSIDTWEAKERKAFKQAPKAEVQANEEYVSKKKKLAKDIKKQYPEMKPKEINQTIDDVMESFTMQEGEDIVGLDTTPELMTKFKELKSFYNKLRNPFPNEKTYRKDIRGRRYLIVDTGIPPKAGQEFTGVYFGGTHKNPKGKQFNTVEEALAALPEMIADEEARDNSENYKSSHWDETNVLAHTRLTDRTDSDGNKVLHIEEIQSDWHQDGRKLGYKTDVASGKAEIEKLEVEMKALVDKYNPMPLENPERKPLVEKYKELQKRKGALEDAEYKGSRSVPDAPFRKNWHEFVFKRMVIEAVNKGYNKISWSTGEQNADLYSLAKQVDHVDVSYNEDGTYDAEAMRGGDPVSSKANIKEAELESLFGKELAQKIVNKEGKQDKSGTFRYEGDDLKVGGEGMKGFYDKILVDFANKFGKKYGARVEDLSISGGVADNYEVIESEQSGLWYIATDDGVHPRSRDYETEIDAHNDLERLRGQESTIVHSLEITEALRDAALTEGFALFQGGADNPLGQVKFGKDGINIDLLRGANPSTFIHEMGHVYLEMMKDLSSREEAPEQVKDDFNKVLKFLGVESADQIQTEQHELFARGFEAYLREGKAPTEGLRKAFANFKAWLLTVYKTLTQLRVELTDEVRGVFDRLVATDEEIAEALNQVTADLDLSKLDVPTKKQEEHLQAIADWKVAAEENLAKKLMADYDRAQTSQYKERRKVVESQVEKEANQLLVYKAISLLRDGTQADGSPLPQGVQSFKLERSSIESLFNKETVARLPSRTVAPLKSGGGVDVRMAASMLGFEDADQMIQALANSIPKQDYIKAQTDERMKTEYPELYDDDRDRLKEEAMSYIHDEMGAKVKRMQLEMIAEKAMPVLKEGIRNVARRLPSDRQIKSQAEKIVGTKQVRDIKPIVFLRAERKAAKDAGVALARGDFEAAYKFKEKELMNFELYRASIRFNNEYKKRLQKAKKIFKSDEKMSKTHDMDLIGAARAMFAEYGIGKQGKTAEEYLSKVKSYDPETYEMLVGLIDASMVKAESLEAMTGDDFFAFTDAAFAIVDLAKTSMEHIVDGKALNREEVIGDLSNTLGEKTKSSERLGFDRKATKWEETKMALLGIKAHLTRVEQLTEALGGNFKKMFYQPVSDAVVNYKSKRKEKLRKWRDLTLAYGKEQPDVFKEKNIKAEELARTDADGVKRFYTFKTKGDLIGALLHVGNESNKKKLLAGRKWGTMNDDGTINSQAWDSFIKRMHDEGVLTKADWDYVQSIWDLMEEMKPDSQKAHKQMYGFYFSEITAEAVVTPFGTYRGGYVPAKADPFLSEDGRIRNDKDAFEKLNNTFMFPTTGRGFTKKRVEHYATPLSIDLKLVGKHIDQSMRFTYIEPTVKSVARIVNDKGFRETMSLFDPTMASEIFIPWLQRAAQQKVTTPGSSRGMDLFWSRLRANAGMNAMFLNVTNALQQFTGWSISALKVSPKYLRSGFWTYFKSPKASALMVAEKSAFMNSRLDGEMNELMQEMDELLSDPNKYDQFKVFAQKNAYILQSGFQNCVDVVTWIGAYDQAVSQGLDEKQAVREADSAVRTTQGSLNAEDVSRFEVGTPFMRVFSMFYSYFNNLANTLATEGYYKAIRDMGLRKGAGRAMYVYFFGFAIPAVMSEVIVKAMSGSDWDEDDDDDVLDDFAMIFFGSQFRTGTAMLPVVGTTAALVYNQFDDAVYNDRLSTSPAISSLESAVVGNAKTMQAIFDEDKDVNPKKATKDFLSAVGLLTGIPTGQVGKTTGYLIDVSQGNAEPAGPVDAVRGAVTGRTPR